MYLSSMDRETCQTLNSSKCLCSMGDMEIEKLSSKRELMNLYHEIPKMADHVYYRKSHIRAHTEHTHTHNVTHWYTTSPLCPLKICNEKKENN